MLGNGNTKAFNDCLVHGARKRHITRPIDIIEIEDGGVVVAIDSQGGAAGPEVFPDILRTDGGLRHVGDGDHIQIHSREA